MPEKKKETKAKELSAREKIKLLLDEGFKINEIAGMYGIKRSEAQRILDYGE